MSEIKLFDADKAFYISTIAPAEWLATMRKLTGTTVVNCELVWASMISSLDEVPGSVKPGVQAYHVPSSPPAGWLKAVRKATGMAGPDCGVLWAAAIMCLEEAPFSRRTA